MKKIGITGGIGTGKSLVAKIFHSLGVPVYYADDESKKLTDHDIDLKNELEFFFGKDIYVNGKLNRELFASIIFSDKSKLLEANKIIHPRVRHHFSEWVEKHRKSTYILKEAAILFESGGEEEMDFVVTVFSPLELRKNRVLQRENMTLNQFNKILNKQLPEEEKIHRADFVIYNDENHLVIPQVLNLHEQFLKIK